MIKYNEYTNLVNLWTVSIYLLGNICSSVEGCNIREISWNSAKRCIIADVRRDYAGIYALLSESQGGLSLTLKLIGILLIIAVLGYLIYSLKQTGVQISLPTVGFGLLQGAVWAGGMIFAFSAFSIGAEAARLVPIYNTNTLIAVILGLFLLHEVPVPEERVKVILGALLIVIGGILVSR